MTPSLTATRGKVAFRARKKAARAHAARERVRTKESRSQELVVAANGIPMSSDEVDSQRMDEARAMIARLLYRRLSKPPDGRHDPRFTFGAALSLEQIAASLFAADFGAPRMLTDLSRETIQTDPNLATAVGKRVAQVASLPIEVVPADGPGIDHDFAKFLADAVRAQVSRIPNMRRAVTQILWGLFDGRSALEKAWAKSPGAVVNIGKKSRQVRYVIGALQWVHPRRLFFGPERELRIVDRPIGIGFSNEGLAMRDYPFHFLEFQPQLFGEYQEREGLSRGCTFWSFHKRFAARERMILLELYAKPWRWGEIDPNADMGTGDLEDFDDIIEQIAGLGYGRLPRGGKMHLEQPGQPGQSGSFHKEVIDSSDAQILKLVLGQTGTTDAKGVSGGMNSNQASIMKDEQLLLASCDAEMAQECLEDFLSDDFVEVNFGPEALTHAPKIKLQLDTKDRKAEIGTINEALKIGLAIAEKDAYEAAGFRKPDSNEPVIRMYSIPGSTNAQGFSTPASDPRPTVEYPPDMVPPQRVMAPDPVAGAAPAIPGETPADEGSGADTATSPVVVEPGSDDPAAGDAVGNNPAAIGPGNRGLGVGDDIARDSNSPGNPETVDKGDRGVLSRTTETAVSVDLGGNGITVLEIRPGGKIALKNGDVVTLPMGPWDSFNDCVKAQEAKGHDADSARRICGAIKKRVEGGIARALESSGGLLDEDRARRLVTVLGERGADEVVLAMRAARAFGGSAIDRYGLNVALAKQPSTLYGSPDQISDRVTRELSLQTREWASTYIDAAASEKEGYRAYAAVSRTATKLDTSEFSRHLARRIVHSEMLGALDSKYERTTDEIVEPAKFEESERRDLAVLLAFDIALAEEQPGAKPGFGGSSYKSAVKWFKSKKVIPKDEFEKLEGGAKRRAFTVAKMTNRDLLNLVHAELGEQIAEGYDPAKFRRMMNERVVSAGWVPANASHIETIGRTNVQEAYVVGRVKDMTQPQALIDRPYWQIRGVDDSRQRETHGAVNGWVLRADDPFFEGALPGAFGYNCRCRPSSISQRQVESRGLTVRSGSEIRDLPDPGFSGSGTRGLLSKFVGG